MIVRRLHPAHRALLLVLIALAFATRAAVPTGWMPMADADGSTRLVLCSGTGPVNMPGMAMPSDAAVTAAPGAHKEPAAPAAEHECPFAVTALAVDLAAPASGLTAPMPPRVAAPILSRPTLLPGRGLAAPPPPATGPPAFA